VGLTIIAYYATTVDGKDYRQILETNIVKDLIKGTLEEGGIYSYDRDKALGSQPSGKGNSMLLTDAYIEDTVRKFSSYDSQTRTLLHSCCNGYYPRVLPKKMQQGLPKYLAIGRSTALALSRCYSMEVHRILFSRFISFTFLGNNMNEGWSIPITLSLAEGLFQLSNIVPIKGSYIGETNLL
jgi:hypothetical protein